MRGYFLLNLVLLLLTYFLVEKDAIKKLSKTRENSFLFSEKILKKKNSISLEFVKLYKKEKWKFKGDRHNQLLDQGYVNKFISQLINLKIERELPDDFKHKNRCSFYIGEDKLEIGDKLNFSENFYVRLNGKSFIVRDTTPQTRPLPKEIYRLNPYKHQKLVNYCKSNKIQFFKKSVFENKKIQEFKLRPTRGFEFSVNFTDFDGAPRPLNGHSFDKLKISKFQNKLSKVVVNSFSFEKPFTSGEKVASLKIDKFDFDLYRYNGRNFLFFKDFSVWGLVQNFDLLNMYYQDLWDTKLVTNSSKTICLNHKKDNRLCFRYKKGRLEGGEQIDIDYQYLNRLVYSITKNSLMLKKITNDKMATFSHDKIIEIDDKRYFYQVDKKIITLVDIDNRFQYDFLWLENSIKVASVEGIRK